MVWGKFVVIEKGEQPTSQDLYKELLDLPQNGTCKGLGACGGSCGISSCACQSRIKSY